MANVIEVQLGAAPWRPDSDATLLEEYDHYEMPLSGVVGQHGHEYLFFCLGGQDTPIHYWMYVEISPEQRQVLESAGSPDEFDKGFHQLQFPGRGMMAVAHDQLGIMGAETFIWGDVSDSQAALGRLRRDVDRLGTQAQASQPIEVPA